MLQWTPIRGTENLLVTSFATTVHAGESFVLAASNRGLLISADGGESWRAPRGVLGEIPVLAVCFSPNYEHDRLSFLGTTGGIAYSSDLLVWKVARLPQGEIHVISLVASPNFGEDGVLLAGTLDYGVLHSSDRGVSWQPRHFGLQDLGVISIAISPGFAQDELVLAGTPSGIFRTPNGSLAWREASVPDEEDPILSLAFSPGYPVDPLILAGTESGRLLQSKDAGRNWTERHTFSPGVPVNALAMSSHPRAGPLLIAGVGSQLWVKSGPGDHWAVIETGTNVLSLAAGDGLNSSPFVLASLEGGGIWRGEAQIP